MALVRLLLLAYILAIIAVIVLSWFPLPRDGAGSRAFVFLRRITDPVLEPVRRLVPPVGGVLDLSPTIVLFALFLLLQILS